MAAIPTAVTTNQMPLCSATPWMPAFCMNLTASDVRGHAAGERDQRGERDLHVELAFRPGAGGIDETTRIEQPGGDRQKPHHDEIADFPSYVPQPDGGRSIAKSGNPGHHPAARRSGGAVSL